jgi:hypothetical protein
MSPSRLRRVIAGLVVLAAATVLPIRTAWSLPEVRLDEQAVDAGAVVDLTYPSSHLAVKWTGAETDVVALRWRAAGGPWSAWEEATVSHDLSDGETGKQASGLVPVTDAVDAQVRVVSGAPTDLSLVAIDTAHGPRHLVVNHPAAYGQTVPTSTTTSSTTTTAAPTTTTTAPAGSKSGPPPVPQPSVITRAQWGADESLRGPDPQQFAPIRRLALHHTAGDEGPDPAATVRAIYAYHTQSNGWNDIGYNFLVDSYGRIYEGRYARDYLPGEIPTGETRDGLGVIGAHTSGNNTGTVGVALLGDFSTTGRPTAAAIAAAERIFAWKADRHDIDVLGTTQWTTGEKSTLIGHRDAVNTACPGQNLYDQLPAMRQRIAAVVGPVGAKPATSGYWVFTKDTGLYTFGDAPFLGGAGEIPAPAVSMAPTRTGQGYWLLSANGRLSAYGDAGNYGSTESMRLNAPAVRLEPTRTGKGYWIQAADGGIFSFGDAAFFGSTGSMKLNSPVISMAATPTGKGYWLLAGDGGVFTFGDAAFFGSTGSMKLNAPVVSMAPNPSGQGYWLQARDGGIFSFGEADFYGSVPGLGVPSANTSQIRATPTGNGYYVMSTDGGIYTFGDARFYGAASGVKGAIDLGLKFVNLPPNG